MLMNEVSKRTGLTKKAIEYYAMQGLVTPGALENGYRTFSEQDLVTLNKIRILRMLEVGTDEIKTILSDPTNAAVQTVAIRKTLDVQQHVRKQDLLAKLGSGISYSEIGAELQMLEQSRSILDKLLDAFPGCYGRLICLHFSRFLNEPIQTKVQQSAYEQIIAFLDSAPPFDLPEELEEYLTEGTAHISVSQMQGMLQQTRASIAHPEEFLADNREILEQYLAYKQSEEYRNSPACRLMECMKQMHNVSGYNTVFLPAMKQLSSAYAQYVCQLELANEKLLAQYPQISQ